MVYYLARSFQPTLPAKGETCRACMAYTLHSDFNPLSQQRERLFSHCMSRIRCRFQPTLPAKGETCQRCAAVHHCKISTHSPSKGRDVDCCTLHYSLDVFQPTLPAKGETHLSWPVRRWEPYFNPLSQQRERPDLHQYRFPARNNFNPLSQQRERPSGEWVCGE